LPYRLAIALNAISYYTPTHFYFSILITIF